MYIGENYYNHFPQLQKIIQLYQDIDEVITMIKTWFAVACPPGCGVCCDTHSDKIEASITEMLPLCVYLYENKTYQSWLDRANQERCIFYSQASLQGRTGCCMVYDYRPLVCRLFGFTFMKDKYGGVMPVACSVLKRTFNEKIPSNKVPIKAYPELRSFSLQSMMLDPFGGKRYPINEAFINAMEYVILKIDLLQRDSTTQHDNDKEIQQGEPSRSRSQTS